MYLVCLAELLVRHLGGVQLNQAQLGLILCINEWLGPET